MKPQRIILLTINEGLAISGVMPTAQPGVEYLARLTGHGGIVPYQWFLDAGTLPAGLTLTTDSNGDANIIGTTSVIGWHEITIMLRDAEGRSVRRTYRLIVQAEPLVISGDAPAGQVGVPYSYTYTVGGGLPSYTFSISSGALPAGLSLNPSTGAISGTPTTGESTSFRVRVTDSQVPPATTDLDDSISVAYATLAVAGAWAGVDVGQPLGGSPRAITGGLAPYAVSLLSGTRPAGVTISVSGSSLVASGNTTTAASYTWTDRVTSADGQYFDIASSLTIAAPAYPVHSQTYTNLSNGGSGISIDVTGSATGDLLILLVGSASTISTPSGWTSHGTATSGPRAYVFSRVLTAPLTTVSLTGGFSAGLVIHALQIDAGTFDASTAIEIVRTTHASSLTHTMPSITPSWGSAPALFVATIVTSTLGAAGFKGFSAHPLPDVQRTTFPGTGGAGVPTAGTCSVGSTASTFSPGNYVCVTAGTSITVTIAIKPA